MTQRTLNPADHASNAAAATVPDDRESGIPGSIGRVEFITIVALLMALNALAIDIILPAFPDVAETYGLGSPTDSQFTILAYLIGFGAMQLVFGPISDRYGRKSPLVVGIGLYIACSLAGALAPNYEWLLASRFAQGMGAASTRIIAISIIRDTHKGRDMASVMSLVLMVFMIVPVVAPISGQVFVSLADWRFIFAFMAVVGAAALVWTLVRMPETLAPENRRELTARRVIEAFHIVLTTRSAFWYAIGASFAFGILFAYINIAQPIIGEHYGLGAWFPAIFAVIAGMMAFTSYMNSRLVRALGQRRISHTAVCVQLATGLVFIVTSLLFEIPLTLFVIYGMLIMSSFSLIGANFNSLAMEELGAVAGSGSSVLGFGTTVIGGILGTIVGQLYNDALWPVAVGLSAISAGTLIVVLVGERGQLFANGDE